MDHGNDAMMFHSCFPLSFNETVGNENRGLHPS